MPEGFTVSTDALHQASQSAGDFADQTRSIKDDASQAEVSDIAWGLVGQLVKGDYDDLLQQFTQHLDEVQEGLTAIKDKIGQSAQQYDEVDQRIGDDLQQIISDLKSGGGK